MPRIHANRHHLVRLQRPAMQRLKYNMRCLLYTSGVHIDTALLKNGVFDTFGAQILLRAGGATAYAEIQPQTRLDITRPE